MEVARRILDNLPEGVADERLKTDLILALSFHDTGKAATGFQEVLNHKRKNWNHRRHEILSASFASSYGLSDEIVFAILTHHLQIPQEVGVPSMTRTLEFEEIPFQNSEPSPVWLRMKNEWERGRSDFSSSWGNICRAVHLEDRVSKNVLPALKLSRRWFDRGQKGQKLSMKFEERLRASCLRGLLIASDHLASGHHMPPVAIQFEDFSIIADPRGFQKRCQDCEGSILLRAPTGSGKTEASLLWAQANQEKNARLLYVLPNIASINAMRLRLENIFGQDKVGLLHSRATAAVYRLMENNDDLMSKLNQTRALELSKLARTIWFPIRVSTPHQILRHSLKGKGWEIMLAEFPKACFIFDEIHAYEPRIVGLTLATVKLFSGWDSKFCFMSATFPSFLREKISKIVRFESIDPSQEEPTDAEILGKKRHFIEVKEGTYLENLEAVLSSVAEYENVLIVCNTVRSAQFVYESIHVADKLLLHSRFNENDRFRIEERLSRPTKPRVVVATQAIEVSLDVDFQRGFLEPAPIDAMIQRMGRVNRFGMMPKPAKVTIFRNEMSKHSVYMNRDRVKRSVEAIESLSKPATENDLASAADAIYGTGYSSDELEEYNEGFNHPDLADFKENLIAGASEDWVESVIERTDRNIDVIPISLREKYRSLMSTGLWAEANGLVVPVQVKSVAWLIKKGLVDPSSDPWIISCHYDGERGLVFEEDTQSAII